MFSTTPSKEYIAWFNKVQDSQQGQWETSGIYDIIQLSRSGPKYNFLMLLSLILFWEDSTNTFHLPYGMVTPTLFYVGAITGFSPLGRNYNPIEQPSSEFKFDNSSFRQYIIDHHDKENSEISDLEHIAFLTLCLCYFCFCSGSLQAAALLNVIWFKFLTPTILLTRLESSKSNLGFTSYQPNLVAKHLD